MTSATTYLSGSGAFDQAIVDFAETYADQNERDYAASRPPSRTAEAKRGALPILGGASPSQDGGTD